MHTIPFAMPDGNAPAFLWRALAPLLRRKTGIARKARGILAPIGQHKARVKAGIWVGIWVGIL